MMNEFDFVAEMLVWTVIVFVPDGRVVEIRDNFVDDDEDTQKKMSCWGKEDRPF